MGLGYISGTTYATAQGNNIYNETGIFTEYA